MIIPKKFLIIILKKKYLSNSNNVITAKDKENKEKAINEIRRFGNIIISSSCYEDNDCSFVCFWNKK